MNNKLPTCSETQAPPPLEEFCLLFIHDIHPYVYLLINCKVLLLSNQEDDNGMEPQREVKFFFAYVSIDITFASITSYSAAF